MMQPCRGCARPVLLACAALSLLVPLAGCGRGRGTVSGVVLFQNKPLPGGLLTFRPSNPGENPVTVPISPEGRYEATLPTGDVLIGVDNRELLPPQKGGGPPPSLPSGIKLPPLKVEPASGPAGAKEKEPRKGAGQYVPIPDKYYSTDTSGLRYKVGKGNQSYDIPLE